MKKVLQKYWAWAFVVIPLLLQAIFFYVPMFQGAFYSFTNWTGLTYNYKFVGLNNFKLLFMDPKFMNAIGFTAIITIAMVVGEIALGIFIARVLNSKIKGQTFFLAGLQSIPTEITEAARIDGATSKQVFWNIELPYLLPSVSIVFILALKGGLTAFDQVFAMTGGGPNNATTSLGLLVYNYAFKNNQFGYANAIAVILFFLIVVISIIQLRVSKKFEI
ncbi:sugar ABC transporter permease [Streptococcus pneumoniae]|nr:sugar ABC transporter permease [Streptococcus pneumoniae]